LVKDKAGSADVKQVNWQQQESVVCYAQIISQLLILFIASNGLLAKKKNY
jgi:hypothetical protein